MRKKDLSDGTGQPKTKIRSLFTHPHVISNLYDFLSSIEHKQKDSEDCFPCNYNELGLKRSRLKRMQKHHKSNFHDLSFESIMQNVCLRNRPNQSHHLL